MPSLLRRRRSPAPAVLALLGLLALGLAPGELGAQVRFDAASGDYFVMVRNDQGALVEMRVEPPNKVRVTLTPTVEAAGALLRYRYAAAVTTESRQELAFLEIDCPGAALVQAFAAQVTVQGATASWFAEFVDFPGRPSCSFERGADGLPIGGVLVGQFETPLRLAIGGARALGKTVGVSWPTSDPRPDNEEAGEVVATLSGLTGGWWALTTVVPARDPSLFNDPGQAFALVAGDLEQLCGPLGWITSGGVCNSLRVKLEHAGQAAAGGDIQNARDLLDSFLNELEAQHGAEPGKHVTDNAYFLLKTNVELLRSRLGQPN
ncbi:MAG: hypothetical protein ACREN5_07325, partial [Gemmatimonadales bacterium]